MAVEPGETRQQRRARKIGDNPYSVEHWKRVQDQLRKNTRKRSHRDNGRCGVWPTQNRATVASFVGHRQGNLHRVRKARGRTL
jgi:hypothetical protein